MSAIQEALVIDYSPRVRSTLKCFGNLRFSKFIYNKCLFFNQNTASSFECQLDNLYQSSVDASMVNAFWSGSLSLQSLGSKKVRSFECITNFSRPAYLWKNTPRYSANHCKRRQHRLSNRKLMLFIAIPLIYLVSYLI